MQDWGLVCRCLGPPSAARERPVSWSKDGGETFAEPETAVSTKGYSDAPKLVVDDRGTVHLVFAEQSDGMFAQARVAYAQRTKIREAMRPPNPKLGAQGLPDNHDRSLSGPAAGLEVCTERRDIQRVLSARGLAPRAPPAPLLVPLGQLRFSF